MNTYTIGYRAGSNGATPQLRITGKLLRELGFQVGDTVAVVREPGGLRICRYLAPIVMPPIPPTLAALEPAA